MLLQQVEKTVEAMFQKLVTGSFHFGLEPIKDYVFFYCMAAYVQSQNSETMSIREYANQTFEAEDTSTTNDDNQFGADYERENDYERKLDHFNNLNFENKLNLLQRQLTEQSRKKDKDKSRVNVKLKRYEGIPLKGFQLDQFSILHQIKEGKFDAVKANTSYKRMVSDKGYLHKMNFREFQDFVQVLKEEIDELDAAYKNIQYYKLEKRLNLELYKSVLKALNQCRQTEPFHEEEAVSDLMKTFHLPIITIRQGYAKLYPELNVEEKMIWRMEVEGIHRLLVYCIQELQGEQGMAFTRYIEKKDWKRFETIYQPSTFQNKYKMRRDFSAKDFNVMQRALDTYNTAVYPLMIELLKRKGSGDLV